MNDAAKVDALLAEDCGRLADKPLEWVLWAFDWENDPVLQLVKLPEPWASRYGRTYGPDKWACEQLEQWGEEIRKRKFDGVQAVAPIRMADSSGHGIGKSAFVSWAILFVQSTRPFAKGIITANTAEQLRTKTWAELAKWKARCLTSHWFDLNTGKGNLTLTHVQYPETWRVDGQTCREENSESFAGLHAANSTPYYIFDEASAVPNVIWEVAEGGLTDGEPMWFVFGNPTRNSGKFRECFGSQRHRWITRQIDSRTVQVTNKALIDEWVDDYGEDSDFVRVRVRGVFPRASSLQFLPSDLVHTARTRELPPITHEPLVAALDVARGGDDECVIRFRRGLDARSLPPIKIPGSEVHDSMRLVAKVVEVVREHNPAALFVDTTGGSVGGPVADRLRQMGVNVVGVGFSDAAPEPGYANMRAYIYARLKRALQSGLCIDDDPKLETDLTSVEFGQDNKDRLLLERKRSMKARGLASPDDGDALAMLCAYDMAPVGERYPGAEGGHQVEYDPFV